MTRRFNAPLFRELREAVPNRPAGTTWGVFGDAFELGTLNFIDRACIVDALKEIKNTDVFSLNWDFCFPDPHPDSTRKPPQRVQVGQGGPMRDDYIDRMPLQYSSQWDGLRHARMPEGFYNGVSANLVDDPQSDVLGIQVWGKRGIVGRGVLLDVDVYLRGKGEPYRADSAYPITADILQATADAQNVEIRTGDIVMMRTGWVTHYEGLSVAQRKQIDHKLHQAGLAREQKSLEWLWDNQIAAIVSDNGGVEVMPVEGYPNIDLDNFYHMRLIGGLGLVLGESFYLDDLANACKADGRYACFFSAAPFNLRGGVGSPANAIALR
jgi:kynurenine formamidase